MNKVGIFVKKPESIFSNGCIQQALFIKQIIEEIGYQTDFITIDDNYTHFSENGTQINKIDISSDLSMYKLFIFISSVILNDNPLLINIKKHDIKCVELICGNLYVLHHEEFVFNKHEIINTSIKNICDESWILEMYPFMTEYIEFLTNKPTNLLPYVWNTDIIEDYVKINNLNISVNYETVNRDKMNILIFEPNMSIHKTCLVPLLIANRYHMKYPTRLNKVYVFCGEHVKDSNIDFIRNLEICKDGILEIYDRKVMPMMLNVIKENNDYINTVLSHNILNNLNFLHLELFHLGIPVVHNCEPFKSNDMYYDDFSLHKSVNILENTRKTFKNDQLYQTIVRKIIDEYSPKNKERMAVYKKHIERLMGIELCELQSDNINISNLKRFELLMLENKDNKDDANNKNLQYPNYGKGLVITVVDQTDIDDLHITLNSLKNIKNNFPVEIICMSEHKLYEDVKQSNIIRNSTNLPYDVDVIHHQIEKCAMNQFSAVKMSSFEEILCVCPGQCFYTSLGLFFNKSDETYETAPCRTIINVLKYNSFDDSTTRFLKHFIQDTNDYMIDANLFYVNKTDLRVKQLLNIMTSDDMSSIHIDTSLLFSIVKNNLFGYENNYDLLRNFNHKMYVTGIIHDKFKGYGKVHVKNDKSILLSRIINKDILKNTLDENIKKVMVEADSNIEFNFTKEGFIGFKGKAVAKNIPLEVM